MNAGVNLGSLLRIRRGGGGLGGGEKGVSQPQAANY